MATCARSPAPALTAATIAALAAVLIIGGCESGDPAKRTKWKDGTATVTLSKDGVLRVRGPGIITKQYYRIFPDKNETGYSYEIGVMEGRTRYQSWATFVPYNTVIIDDDVALVAGLGGSKNLTSVRFGKSVTHIDNYAFADADLRSLELPDNLYLISDGAFEGNDNLTSVKFPNSLVDIRKRAFYGTGLTSVTIPPNVTSIGEAAFAGSSNLTDIFVDENNPSYRSVNGMLFYKDENRLSAYPSGRSGAYNIPVDVTASYSAFMGCYGLTAINADKDHPAYSTVSGVLFNKSKDTLIAYPAGVQGAYTVPNGVKSISGAFVGCKYLTSIRLPASVTDVGINPFDGCTGLTSIISLNPIPRVIREYEWGDATETACLYVPGSGVDAYRAAVGWNRFKCIKPISALEDS